MLTTTSIKCVLWAWQKPAKRVRKALPVPASHSYSLVLEMTAFKCKAPVVKMKTPILDFFIWLSVYPTSSLKRKLWPFRGAQKSLQASTVQLEPAPTWPRVVQTLHVTSWRHVNPSHSRLGFWAPGIISWLTHTPQHFHEPVLLEWDSTFSRSTHEYTLPTQGSPRNHLMYPG